MRRRTKRSEIRAAREMRAKGVPYRLIEVRLGRCKSWIQAHAKDVPGAVRRGVEPSAETRKAVIHMRRNGVRQVEIADRLEISLHWVRKWSQGVAVYPDRKRPARALQMANDGMSNAQIANALGYKNARVACSVIVKERGRQKEQPGCLVQR